VAAPEVPIALDSEASALSTRTAPAPPTEGTPWPSATRAWYAVAIFALSLTINFLDRGILTLLIGPLKHDLRLSDTQVSLLVGFAFVLFYMLLGLPIARLVDTRSRRLIISTGIAIWSVMTALCGIAQSFLQLFIARVGVGVGEACSGPATYSMLSDLFPPAKLPRAIAVMNFGFVSGTAFALLIGGTVIHFVAELPPVSLPLVGLLHPWQITFILVGVPGLLVAALFMTVREPIRRGRISGTVVRSLPIGKVVSFLKDNRAAYGPMFLGLAVNAILTFGNQAWLPELFRRTYGWAPAQVGVVQGIVLLAAAPLGLMAGSALAERLAKKGYTDANVRVTVLAYALTVPSAVLIPLMPTPELAITLSGLQWFTAMLSPGPQNAALQIITPNQMRGQVTALYLFVFNIIGFGLGPTFVAFLTDYIFRNEAHLRYALAMSAAIMGPLATYIVYLGMKPYGESVIRARGWS
jgi:MFS family permease